MGGWPELPIPDVWQTVQVPTPCKMVLMSLKRRADGVYVRALSTTITSFTSALCAAPLPVRSITQ